MSGSGLLHRCTLATAALSALRPFSIEGRFESISGTIVAIEGLSHHLVIGQRIVLRPRNGGLISGEIVGFRDGRAQAMLHGEPAGLGPGCTVLAGAREAGPGLTVSEAWLGRVIDPLGRPLDGAGPMPPGPPRPLRAPPPEAARRARLGPPLDLGIAALDAFATCRSGQRLGIFAGSGVGKSTLLSMLARFVAAEVVVLALIGERGREVRDFLEDELGADGLARSVVVVATSDAPPLLRRDAAYAAMTVAEFFRDRGRSVLLLMDSVTRFCFALREIGLSAGEPPVARGYPPSVFAELPKLLERAGPGPEGAGSITGLFSVLVDGDDHDEPVADAVRGFLDGHVVLDRGIAQRGRFPAVDVLRTVSRSAPGCLPPPRAEAVRRARAILRRHAELSDLIRLGAYRPGNDVLDDEAVAVAPALEAVLEQPKHARMSSDETFSRLERALAAGTG